MPSSLAIHKSCSRAAPKPRCSFLSLAPFFKPVQLLLPLAITVPFLLARALAFLGRPAPRPTERSSAPCIISSRVQVNCLSLRPTSAAAPSFLSPSSPTTQSAA